MQWPDHLAYLPRQPLLRASSAGNLPYLSQVAIYQSHPLRSFAPRIFHLLRLQL
jgi:hypothetical protein